MIQTSKRGLQKRTTRKRLKAMNPVTLNETNPSGNRLTRRKQAKFDRTILETLRKEGWQRHLKNLRDSVVKGYKLRMARIAERKKQRINS